LANLCAALYAGATVLTHLLGWDTGPHANALFWAAVLLIGIAAGTYTLLGGLRAVIYCDFIQMLVLVLGGALLLVFGIHRAGGLSAVLAFHDQAGRSMWSLARPWHHEFGWLPMLTGTVVLGVHGHCTDQDYVQRALAAGSLYHARMGAVFGGFLKVLALFVIAAPGVVAAQLVAQGTLTINEGDSAYVALLTGVMPTGLLGICLAGLLAAIMSSVDSGLCACSSLLTYDFYAQFKKSVNDKALLRDGRIIMVVLLLVCILVAPAIRHFEGLFNYLLYVWALLAPPVFVCILFGLYDPRAHARAALVTLIVGCILGLVAFAVLKFPLLDTFRQTLPVYLQNKLNWGFINTVICALVMFALSRLRAGTDDDQQRVQAVRQSSDIMRMAPSETLRYWLFSLSLILVWITVLLCFSPLGIGK